ncbi:MAG: tripartite tricarboxylate transporter substrate binding protein, partial [Burkholderiales bacterium]
MNSSRLAEAGTCITSEQRLNVALVSALQVAEVRERLKTLGGEPVGTSPTELASYLKAELSRWVT